MRDIAGHSRKKHALSFISRIKTLRDDEKRERVKVTNTGCLTQINQVPLKKVVILNLFQDLPRLSLLLPLRNGMRDDNFTINLLNANFFGRVLVTYV